MQIAFRNEVTQAKSKIYRNLLEFMGIPVSRTSEGEMLLHLNFQQRSVN